MASVNRKRRLTGTRTMWETDPRIQKLLLDPDGPIDWSVFTQDELRQLLEETYGSMPDLPLPPKAEFLV